MKSIILLNSNENTSVVEEEEKTRFIRSILASFELPIDDYWDEEGKITIDNKIKLRSLLSTLNIQIIDNSDGEIQVFCDGTVIAKWNKCEYVLRRDLKERDPAKKLYLEMKTDHWSIFEDLEENAQ